MKGFYSILAVVLTSLVLATIAYGILSLSDAQNADLTLLQGRLVQESADDAQKYVNDTLDDALFDLAWQACPCAQGFYDEQNALNTMDAYAASAIGNFSLFTPSVLATPTGSVAPSSFSCDSEGDFHYYVSLDSSLGNASIKRLGQDFGKRVRVTLDSSVTISLYSFTGVLHRSAVIACGGGTTTTTIGTTTTTTTLATTTTTTTTLGGGVGGGSTGV